jgi:hypothetical protein
LSDENLKGINQLLNATKKQQEQSPMHHPKLRLKLHIPWFMTPSPHKKSPPKFGRFWLFSEAM